MPLQREQLHTVRQGAAESNTSCWGLHVRHGDLKALSTVYSYKEIFEFEDYFTVARSLSNVLQESPQCIFVSTDSVEADDLQSIFDRFNEREVKQLQAPAQKKEKKSSTGSSPRYARQYRRSVSASDTEYSDYSTDDVDEEHHGVVEGVVETSSQPLWKATDKSKKMSAAQGFDRGTIHSARSDAAAPFASNGFAHDDDNERDAADDDDDYDEDDDDDSDWEAFNNNKVNSDLVDSLLHSSGGNRNSWYEHRIPAVHTINNVDRYRTKHGSHTVAANGGCLRDPNYDKRGMRCALNYEDIVLYQGIEEHRSVPRSLRLMRVLLESIEDLYLLSRCERLVAQGSSHFSTLAALLIWARTGVRQIENVNVYLDAPSIAAGFTPTAYLHGMNLLNGTHGVDTTNPAAGRQRWQMHTFSFISGLKTDLIDNTQLYPDGAFLAPQNWMQLVEGLPRLPEKIFYWEARSWLGRGKRGQQHTYEPSWPGHCPADMPRGHDPTMFAGAVVNLGVDHLGASHTGQALQCWQVALQALETIPKKKWDKKIQNIAEVARENAKTQWIMRYAEMVINENRNPAEYLSYSAKYMQKTFDGVSSFGQTAGGYAAGGGGGGLIEQLPLGDSFSGGMDNGRMSLDDLQEEINRLEAHLAKLKELRDRMLDVSRQYASVRHQ